jgi:hypothetical protein
MQAKGHAAFLSQLDTMFVPEIFLTGRSIISSVNFKTIESANFLY